MKLKLVRHLWGVDWAPGISHYAKAWRTFGYEAIEFSIRQAPDKPAFLKFLKEFEFDWIPQVFSRDFIPGGTVREHFDSLRGQVEECLDHQPLLFNAHTGSDAWTPAEAEDFYGQAVELEARIGVPIAHETHRLRYFGIPWQTDAILRAFPALKLTCDFSHWVCVCERLLPDLGDLIARCAQHAQHLHARVGYEEGPQVPDPAAPEYAAHLAAHEGWWDQLWQAQRARGMAVSTLTPEFGPAPYMPMLPYTQTPVANLARICDWMAARQRARFSSVIN